MNYSMKKVAQITEVTSSTIRYYETIGVLPKFKRNENNIRYFTEEDIELINLVKCLRRIGMPLSEVKENITKFLSDDKKTTNEILIEHKEKLLKQIELLNFYIDEIDKKL
ncbi:MAG: MerR family transcriptional regulator [Clostridium sp.]